MSDRVRGSAGDVYFKKKEKKNIISLFLCYHLFFNDCLKTTRVVFISRLTLTLFLGPVKTSSTCFRRPRGRKLRMEDVFLVGRELAVMTGTAMLRDGRGSRIVDGRTCV